MVPADSHRASPTPRYSGGHYTIYLDIYGTVTLYGLTFQKILFKIYHDDVTPTTPTMP